MKTCLLSELSLPVAADLVAFERAKVRGASIRLGARARAKVVPEDAGTSRRVQCLDSSRVFEAVRAD